MGYGSMRVLVRCGTEERRIEPEKLGETVEEFRRARPSEWIEVRALGIVRG
jgi:hypothetical protein